MAILKFSNVSIDGISVVVPKTVIDNSNYSDFISEHEAKSIMKMTGIKARRFATPDVCASDLCFAAATNLMQSLSIDPSSIDAIIFVSLTPDYRMPATAFLLHSKLGFKKECMAMDISLGCSGFIYGLSVVFNLLQQNSIKRVLLLNGETKSKTYGKRDKSTSLLFGDAGSATLVSKTSKELPTTVSLQSDGSRYEAIIIPNGGYRNPSNEESSVEKLQPDGNWRSQEQGVMDGPAIFDFTITEVPTDIQNTLKECDTSIEEIDYFLFHQANKFITDHIGKKLKIPSCKIPYSLDKYGNTASVSIPQTICSELMDVSGHIGQVCLSAFGVGLSWGTIITSLENCKVLPICEYDTKG